MRTTCSNIKSLREGLKPRISLSTQGKSQPNCVVVFVLSYFSIVSAFVLYLRIMGTGWRRAFCTSDPESTIHTKHRTHSPTPSPRSCVSLGFLSAPSLLHHHHQQQQPPLSSTPQNSRCETITEQTNYHGPRIFQTKTKQNPTSPLSPKLKLSLFKNSFKFRTSCGICLNSVKTGQGTAIYTAECGHAFHFPCVVSHARSHVCPVCDATWNDVPFQPNDVVVHTVQTEKQHKQPIHHHSDSVTSYNDDEPLPSPLTTKIVPIPEADENTEEENDDLGEFPGFFVDPKPQSSLRQNGVAVAHSRTVRVKLMPECAVISVSQSHKTYAVGLRVKAPPSPRRRRPPIDLVTVLDVSNGMSGAKLHMLKRAMRLVISSLGAADRLAVVAPLANYSKRLMALRRMTAQGQRAARRVVDRLVCGEGNSVGEEAMKKAAKVLEDRRERNPLAKILLLSNGHDNNSINQQRWLSHMSFSRFSCVEVPVRSCGFGTFKTGFTHEPLEDTFSQYITEILCVAVQDLRIQLGFSAPAEIGAVYSCSAGPTALNSNEARLGDLYAEEEKELLVEVRVPTSALGSHHVMKVRCVTRNPSCEEFVYGAEQVFTVVPPKHTTTSRCGDRVEKLRNVFITSRAVAESRRLAKHNEFSSAHQLLTSAQALLMQLGSADEYIRGIEAELEEVEWRKQQHETVVMGRRRESERGMRLEDESGEVLTPTSAWRAAEKLAKMAMVKTSLNEVSDLHGFENARF